MMQTTAVAVLRRSANSSRLSRASNGIHVVRSKSTRPDPSSSLIDTATDYFAALRWRAATALTSSLNSEEKEALLQKLDVKPSGKSQEQQEEDEQAQVLISNSIGEAVAAARAQEAQRHEAKWEREREAIMRQAEEAAQARVRSDLLIQERRMALERWQQELEREKTQEEQQQEEEAKTTTTTDTSSTEQQREEDEVDHHPVLGPAVVDLGYKRVHVVESKALASIPIWKKQRIYRHARAKAMAADKSKTQELGLPGVISLHEAPDGKLSILDGQHRVGMMTILQKNMEGTEITYLDRILVEVFPQSDKQNCVAQDIFLEINKAEPIKLVDMPGVAKKGDRKVITDAAAKLEEQFPEMFKHSQNCRAPHMNIDNLRDALFASDVLKRHSLTSPKALVDWILTQNELLKANFEKEPEKVSNKTALEKATKHNFFLGLDSSWLYN